MAGAMKTTTIRAAAMALALTGWAWSQEREPADLTPAHNGGDTDRDGHYSVEEMRARARAGLVGVPGELQARARAGDRGAAAEIRRIQAHQRARGARMRGEISAEQEVALQQEANRLASEEARLERLLEAQRELGRAIERLRLEIEEARAR